MLTLSLIAAVGFPLFMVGFQLMRIAEALERIQADQYMIYGIRAVKIEEKP